MLRLVHPGAPRPNLRAGRFFKRLRKLLEYRLDQPPHVLGESDWILYGRKINPHRPGSWKWRHYENAYAACKADEPHRCHPLANAPYRRK